MLLEKLCILTRCKGLSFNGCGLQVLSVILNWLKLSLSGCKDASISSLYSSGKLDDLHQAAAPRESLPSSLQASRPAAEHALILRDKGYPCIVVKPCFRLLCRPREYVLRTDFLVGVEQG